MIAVAQEHVCSKQKPDWHKRFLKMLPMIRRRARFVFKHCTPDVQEDLIEEVEANAFVAYARLVEAGKEERAYPTPLARYAIAQVRCGRRVGASLNCQDVMSHSGRRKKEFVVERLDRQNRESGEWKEALVTDRRTSIADQAAFRIDFPAWLMRQPNRKRRIAETLAVGERARDVAKRFQVSAGRISQMRKEFYHDWHAFHGEENGGQDDAEADR